MIYIEKYDELSVICEQHKLGKNNMEIARHLKTLGDPGNPETIRKRVSKKLNKLLVDSQPVPQKQPKIEVFQNQEPDTFSLPWDGSHLLKFGIVSDCHINSKYTQITYLNNYYDICSCRGIHTVFDAGDIDDGEQMRKGHQYECYNQGSDDHVAEICRVYPEREGIDTYFITGNHDASILKLSGHDIGKDIDQRRKDMHYLGPDCAVIQLTPNCTLELRHPWDGTSYALSYKPQKIVDAMSGGEKPNILAIGHYHKAEYLFYRNVHVLQAGTFCAQTPFMRGKGLAAHVGGWIVEIVVDDNGTIKSIRTEFIPYYVAIKHDYQNWREK